MWTLSDLLKNFFTHKDFLPPADKIPGTMFTPLHFIFSAICLTAVITLAILVSKRSERTVKTVFTVLWITLVVFEVVKIVWESVSGREIRFEWGGVLPLYPCSIFMYAMPFAIFGGERLRRAGTGYVCTLGIVGGAINFVYPATILGNYSCISFAGFHTFMYHGTMVFVALVMLLSHYHSYRGITRAYELALPSVPFLITSIPANIVNYTLGADYMFFKLNSFIFAPIGAVLPDAVATVIVYIAFLIIHALPYLPSYISYRRSAAR